MYRRLPFIEIIRDETTGAESRVAYDDQHRVTSVTDAWGNTTTSDHGHYGPQGSGISGVLLSQTDALGIETAFEYNDLPEKQYNSFSQMFAAYVGSKIGDDSGQSGYLTGAQAQPSTIVQDAGGANLATVIDYDMSENSAAAFQPLSVEDPLGNVTDLDYDAQSGQMTGVKFQPDSGPAGAEVENQYYAATDTDLIFGGSAAKSDGRLKKTRTRANTDANTPWRETIYGYKYEGAAGNLTETHATRDAQTDQTTYSRYDAAGRLTQSTDARARTSTSKYDGEGRLVYASTFFNGWFDAFKIGFAFGAGIVLAVFALTKALIGLGMAAGKAAIVATLTSTILSGAYDGVGSIEEIQSAETDKEFNVAIAGVLFMLIPGRQGKKPKISKVPVPARNSLDINVNPETPAIKEWRGRSVSGGRTPASDRLVQKLAQRASDTGARDIRIDQQQINGREQRVGRNRPDLQYTRSDGKRVYVEVDIDPSTRGPGHRDRILANDPDAIIIRIQNGKIVEGSWVH